MQRTIAGSTAHPRSALGSGRRLIVVSIGLGLFLAWGSAAAAPRKNAVLVVSGAEPRAFVSVDGIRVGRADANGSRRVESFGPGRRTVVVRQLGYRDFTKPVLLVAGGSVTVKPTRVKLTDAAELAFQKAEDLAADGKHAEAVPLFNEAITARNGEYAAARIGLARSLLARKNLDEAAEALAPLLTGKTPNREARTVSANVLRERGFYDEAAAEYRRAIAMAPDRSPEAHAGLAITLDERGDPTQAALEFKKAIAQNGDAEPLLYQLRGGVLEKLDRKREALADYERFLKLAPTSPLASAVASVVDRLKGEVGSTDTPTDEDDVNPYSAP